MQFQQIERKNCDQIKTIVEAKLKELESETGLSFQIEGSMRYSPKNVTMKLNAMVGEFDVENTPAGRSFKANAAHYGMKPEWLEVCFRDHKGDLYRVVGLNTNRPVYPVVCENVVTGKTLLFPPRTVIKALSQ